MNRDRLSLWVACPSLAFADHLKASFESIMSLEERAHLERLHFDRDRREYLVAHVLTRKALSHFHAIPPETWRFNRNPYGKPAIDPECGLRFNVAHSSDLTVCLISQRGEVGVDVEPCDGRGAQILEIATTVFSPDELAQLDLLADAEKANHMLTLWTLKEAFVKAQGKGFSLPLNTISFLRDGVAGFRLHVQASEKNLSANCRFCVIEHKAHRVAIVVESKVSPKVDIWEFESLIDPPKQLAHTQPVFYPLQKSAA